MEHWLTRFTDAQLTAHPRLALAAAGVQLAYGQGHLAEHWLRAAARLRRPRTRCAAGSPRCAPRSAATGWSAWPRTPPARAPCSRPIARARRSAACSRASPTTCAATGSARAGLEDGARRAAVTAPQIHALCLSQLALVALDEDDAEEAARLATRARSQVSRYGLERYPTSALVLAVSGLVRAQRGRVEDASGDLRDAAALLGRLTDLAPWYLIEVADRARPHGVAAQRRQRGTSPAVRGGRPAARLPEARVLANGSTRPRAAGGIHPYGRRACRRR